MLYLYTTETKNEYVLDFEVKLIKTSDLIYDPQKIRDYCKNGCNNFGKSGGCPPFSPLLEEIHNSSDNVWLIKALFDSKYKPEKVKTSNNIAIHWKFQDVILARSLNTIAKTLKNNNYGTYLGTGYCLGCPGKKCSFKIGEKICRNPKNRTFSMESTGIDVVKTVKKVFNQNMYWYSKGKINVPYMIKCLAFFPNKDINNLNIVYNAILSHPRISIIK